MLRSPSASLAANRAHAVRIDRAVRKGVVGIST
jgi:hypothetical protein